jgi:hypothetical protein
MIFEVFTALKMRIVLWGAVLTGEREWLVSDVSTGFCLILLNSGSHTHTPLS